MNLNEIIKLRNRGLSLFPVSKETKIPLIKWDRLQDSLPTFDEIKEWFSVNNRSVGFATGPVSGVLLLDFDFAKHPEAKEFYESHTFPYTWKERTKSGGLHIYFRWTPALNGKQTNTTGKLHMGVDTKGYGGYSKIAPSEGYEWIVSPDVATLAVAPEWLMDLLPAKGINLQTANVTDRFSSVLSSIKDGNRNDSLFRLASSLRARGYSTEAIYGLLKDKARAIAVSDEELHTLVYKSVDRYQQGDGDQAGTGVETFLKDEEKVEWLCEPIVAKKTIGFTVGLPETMKTWLLIDLAIEIARGGGTWLNRFPVKAGRVLFIDQERFKGETQRRFRAVLKQKKLEPSALNDTLYIRCGTTTRINMQSSYDALKKEIADLRPDLVIVDSFATFHTCDENNRQSIQDVLERTKQLRNEFGCSFIFIHHENKYAFNAKKEEREPSIAEMAGSVAIPAAAEFVLTVRRQDPLSSFVHHTKSTLAATVPPFLVKVTDTTEDKSEISVEAF